MGGRGSMGGTRSTYRGDSTRLFRQQQQQGVDNSSNGGGGGGGGDSKGSQNTNQGGITNNNGGGGQGGGGSVIEDQKPTTDINDTDTYDEALMEEFEETPEYEDFYEKFVDDNGDNWNKSDEGLAKFKSELKVAFRNWISGKSDKPDPSGLPFRRKPDNARHTEAQVLADIETINRRHKEISGIWDINCQRCAVAVELRAQGYDVKANSVLDGWLPKTKNSSGRLVGNTATVDQIARMWTDPATGGDGAWSYETRNTLGRANAIKQLEDEIVSWGEGARGFIYVCWTRSKGGGSHIWNVEVRDGKPFYIDGQTGKIQDDTDWKDDFSPQNWRGVMRVDNLQPKDTALTWISDRSNAEINAPNRDEVSTQLERLWPLSSGETAKRNAFFAAWLAVYKDSDTTPPAWVSSPEVLAAFNQGLAWARRPD